MVGLVALFLRNANLDRVLAEIGRARPGLLVIALLITALTYLLRAVRWQFLLHPIGETRFSVVFRATVIGFAASALLPARVGEFLRPYLLARSERLSVTAAFASVVLERLLDLVVVMVFFAAFFLLFDPGVGTRDSAAYAALQIGGLLAGGGGIVAFVLAYFLAGHPESLYTAAGGLERFLPAHVAASVSALVRRFASGLAAVRQPVRLFQALLLSVPLWLSIAATIWLVSVAFHIRLVFTGSFLLMALLVVGVAAPTPGAVGGFHEAYRIGATSFFDVPNDQAVGAAIVLHAVSFMPVTLLGMAFMARSGLNLRGMQKLAAEATTESSVDAPEPAGPGGAASPTVAALADSSSREGGTAG